MDRPFLTLAVTAALASAAHAATPELRGTWVTTTGLTTGTIANRTTTADNFAKMRAIGLNTVYQDAWRAGGTYFRSDAIKAITGSDLATELTTGSTPRGDLFAETLIQSHRNGMAQFAWMQYGFATEYLAGTVPTSTTASKLTNYMKDKGWLLQNSGGGYSGSSGNKYAWMNPLVPEVRKLIIDMGVELVTKYDVDGVEFDDRLAWPTQYGWDTYTKNAYFADTGRNLPSSTATATQPFLDFTAWRATKITAFAQEFSTAIHAANPHALVAAAPGGYSDTLSSYAADAPAWSRSTITVNGATRPTFDEITPQIYNSNADQGSNFKNTFNADINAMDQSHLGSYGVGMSINGGTGTYDWATVNAYQVAAQRARTGTKGHIWWYSPGVLTDTTQLTAYYNVAANGQAERPDQAAGWRPASIVATAAGAGIWTATLTDMPQRYQVIARTGDTWAIVANNVLPPGATTLTTGGNYAGVELLVDRRGFIPGDVNFDNVVNFDDLVALSQNYNGTGKLWTQGDFTLDGVINFDDLAVLAQNFNTGVPAGAQMTFAQALSLVPEPGTVSLAAGATLCLGRRRGIRR